MNKSKINDIMREYQNKRDFSNQELEKRIDSIYNKFPEIKEINDEINHFGLKMTKAVIDGESDDFLSKMEIKHLELLNKKQELLKKYNIDKEDLEPRFECALCKDTGFYEDGERCTCLKQRLLNETYKMSNLDMILAEDNFDTFDINLFSDKVPKGRDLSPRNFMKDVQRDVNNFIFYFNEYDPSKNNNLLFLGKPGLGKTFLCSCIAKEIMNRGNTVIYQTSFNLMDVIERYKFRTESFSTESEENYNNLFKADLLIIDDLGTEMVNSFTISELFNIINSRLISRKKTIISSNLDVVELTSVYTERIFSRIVGNFKIYEFYGYDLRYRIDNE